MPHHPLTRRRTVLAVSLTGLVLAGGVGAAHAATSADDPGPSGYAVVVDDRAAAPVGTDCPYAHADPSTTDPSTTDPSTTDPSTTDPTGGTHP